MPVGRDRQFAMHPGTCLRVRGARFARRAAWQGACGEEAQPRMRTALKLRITWPPAVGRPKLNMGRKREKISI